ncbi:MAG: DUF2851 family protein [Ignavibacteriales bacterium]|nr:DUF2851 family protein [Ignavibacteriales bacterium]
MGKLTFNIHERFLRHIWSRQYLNHFALRTTDNQTIQVFRSGRMNADGGPDFRDAVIQIGETTFHGDVEFHRTIADWQLHRHFEDPRYNKVILHVVFERGSGPVTTRVASGRSIPTLLLEPHLNESIRTLWHKTILDEQLLRKKTLPCSDLNHDVDTALLSRWIKRLAVERLELKLRRFDERLKELAQLRLLAVHDSHGQHGPWRVQGDPDDLPPPHWELTHTQLAPRDFWDQLLYEGFMECLGYSKNQEPFVRLARAVTLRVIRSHRVESNEEALQALLFGAAGLLPKLKTVKDVESRKFARRLSHEWRVQKTLYRGSILHAADWQLFPTRPVNFPTLRIAAATPLIRAILCDDLFRRIIENLKTTNTGGLEVRALRKLLAITPLPYWTHHYRFDQAISKPVHPFGLERTDAAIANVVIPLALLYARIFKDRLVREGALRLFESMPPAAENSVTRFMESQLLRGRVVLRSVSTQQGVIQLYKCYCSEERCVECDVGAVVFGRFSKPR